MADAFIPDVHIGRSWTGTRLEDHCPCPKGACGLVKLREASPQCTQHYWSAARSIRQCHAAEECPAAPTS